LLPLRVFDDEFFAALFCEPVILELTIANRPGVPLKSPGSISQTDAKENCVIRASIAAIRLFSAECA
jgi:hypothetical protein